MITDLITIAIVVICTIIITRSNNSLEKSTKILIESDAELTEIFQQIIKEKNGNGRE